MSSRVPPGGYSSVVFGTDEPETASARKQQKGQSNGSSSGLPKAAKDKVLILINKVSSVEELIDEITSEFSLGGHSVGLDAPNFDSLKNSASFAGPVSQSKVSEALDELHEAFTKRGCDTLFRLGKKFGIMDDDNSKGLSFEEFKKGLVESGVKLDESTFQALFRNFDKDCSGYISFNEFLEGVRPEMNGRRAGLVDSVFNMLDVNGDGALTVDEVSERYDCRMHPDVVAGTATEIDVLQNFLAGFDGSLGPKSSIVTAEKFAAYYAMLSASIDDDDYFELMLRNVWHISGGDGWCENTTNRRLLVTYEDGTQDVQEVEGDADITKEDLQSMKTHLRESGVSVLKVSLYGYVENADNMMTSTSSPRKGGMGSHANGSAQEEEADPEAAVAAYKQRMAQSNVTFA